MAITQLQDELLNYLSAVVLDIEAAVPTSALSNYVAINNIKRLFDSVMYQNNATYRLHVQAMRNNVEGVRAEIKNGADCSHCWAHVFVDTDSHTKFPVNTWTSSLEVVNLLVTAPTNPMCPEQAVSKMIHQRMYEALATLVKRKTSPIRAEHYATYSQFLMTAMNDRMFNDEHTTRWVAELMSLIPDELKFSDNIVTLKLTKAEGYQTLGRVHGLRWYY